MRNETNAFPATIRIATVGIITALTTAIGFVVQFPIPATKGVFTLADMVIFFAAFTLGPVSGGLAGGLGAALFDLLSGYAQYAPASFLIHGLEGLVAGLIAMSVRGRGMSILLWVLGGLAGIVIMVGGYFLAESLIYVGIDLAKVEIPINIVQSGVGAVGGALLCVAVRRAYPPVSRLRW
jgi:uncharacterized membrane protein